MHQTIRHDIFGLTSTPFINAPVHPFVDQQRQRCLEQLERFLHFRGFAAISGRPGVGKTALVRYFVKNLHEPSHKVIYLAFGHLSENDMLKALCSRLDTEPPFRKSAVIGAIQQRVRELQPANIVFVLDEMQNASDRVLDSVRMLANDAFDEGSKFSCLMVGTPEFFEKLRLVVNESLRQRITCFCELQELTETDTEKYVAHCLSEAGVQQPVFEPQALKLLADAAGGTMRLMAQLAAVSMAIASAEESTTVTLKHVQQATQNALLPARRQRQA